MKNFPHEWREIIKLCMNRITILAAKVLFVSSSPSYLLCGGIYRTFMREFDSGATRHNSNPRPYSSPTPEALGLFLACCHRSVTPLILCWFDFRSEVFCLVFTYIKQTIYRDLFYTRKCYHLYGYVLPFYPDWYTSRLKLFLIVGASLGGIGKEAFFQV